ncbi:hypothetical protein RQP46_007543 [Phenoliferia psychrophenolica]
MSQQAPYTVHEKYTFAPRRMRIVMIGAGVSGIYMGIRIPQVLSDVDLVIYEKNASMGGTWHENKYPGCACDVPSHRYSYSFEPNPDFPNYYSDSDALEAYFTGVAKKYGVEKYVQFETAVTSASWDEDSGKWNLKLSGPQGDFVDTCDVLLNGSGILNAWKWPDIKHLNDFRGALLHTAKYDRTIPLEGKRVAVIGSGSSGIQVVAAIQPKVAHLGTYIRSPTWIIPPMNTDFAPKNADGTPDYRYSPEQRERFKTDPKAVGCRRITPGIGYLESLVKDNVECIFGGISHFTATGIVDEKGVERPYDVIICATGFDVSFAARFPFVGREGRELDAAFGTNPKSYLSLAYGGYPNHFVFNGPSSPIGNGSVLPCIESEGEYMIKCIRKMQAQDIKSMCVKDPAVEEFATHTDAFMPRMVWTDNCRSWYKANGTGRVTALWPGSAYNFITAIEDVRWEDYDYTYLDSGSRFSYLGQGRSMEEMYDIDISGYLEARLNLTAGHPALAEASATTKANGLNGH